ncbi:hypothetical protein Tco_0768228 [Tanacetum coccineum]
MEEEPCLEQNQDWSIRKSYLSMFGKLECSQQKSEMEYSSQGDGHLVGIFLRNLNEPPGPVVDRGKSIQLQKFFHLLFNRHRGFLEFTLLDVGLLGAIVLIHRESCGTKFSGLIPLNVRKFPIESLSCGL